MIGYREDSYHQRSPSDTYASPSRRLLDSANLSTEYLPARRTTVVTSGSAIKKISTTANKLMDILSNDPSSKDSTSMREVPPIRYPLSTRDDNEPSSALTAKFQEDQYSSYIAKTAGMRSNSISQGSEFHLKESSDLLSPYDNNSRLYERPKQISRFPQDNKENPELSAQSRTDVTLLTLDGV